MECELVKDINTQTSYKFGKNDNLTGKVRRSNESNETYKSKDERLLISELNLQPQTSNVEPQTIYPAHPSLSRLLYWMASARCSGLMFSLPARSAIVRATFKILS